MPCSEASTPRCGLQPLRPKNNYQRRSHLLFSLGPFPCETWDWPQTEHLLLFVVALSRWSDRPEARGTATPWSCSDAVNGVRVMPCSEASTPRCAVYEFPSSPVVKVTRRRQRGRLLRRRRQPGEAVRDELRKIAGSGDEDNDADGSCALCEAKIAGSGDEDDEADGSCALYEITTTRSRRRGLQWWRHRLRRLLWMIARVERSTQPTSGQHANMLYGVPSDTPVFSDTHNQTHTCSLYGHLCCCSF